VWLLKNIENGCRAIGALLQNAPITTAKDLASLLQEEREYKNSELRKSCLKKDVRNTYEGPKSKLVQVDLNGIHDSSFDLDELVNLQSERPPMLDEESRPIYDLNMRDGVVALEARGTSWEGIAKALLTKIGPVAAEGLSNHPIAAL